MTAQQSESLRQREAMAQSEVHRVSEGQGRRLCSASSSSDLTARSEVLQVDEGQQYLLEGIRFSNNKAVQNLAALRDLFPSKDGEVFDHAAVEKGLDNLGRAYAELGYINFTSVPESRINAERHTVSLDITLNEGEQFSISRVDIVGLDERTFQSVAKDLIVVPGQVYNQRLVDLFLKKNASHFQADGSVEPRFKLQPDETTKTVAITYDFRPCSLQ